MSKKMTASSGNVFEDLGFAPDEAAAMLADEPGVPRTRISEVMHDKANGSSTDRLAALLHRSRKRTELRIS